MIRTAATRKPEENKIRSACGSKSTEVDAGGEGERWEETRRVETSKESRVNERRGYERRAVYKCLL